MMIKDYLASSAQAIERVDAGEIDNAVRILQEVRDSGNTVWTLGNGGSAATAEHLANDLLKMAGVRAISITSLVAQFTAYGNDNGWERMYADPLAALHRDGDALVAISCSGNSQNVVNAARLFHHTRLIILTGDRYDSALAVMDADAKVFVPDGDIKVQEDAHLAACHAIAGALRC